jgi:hypothetical protein
VYLVNDDVRVARDLTCMCVCRGDRAPDQPWGAHASACICGARWRSCKCRPTRVPRRLPSQPPPHPPRPLSLRPWCWVGSRHRRPSPSRPPPYACPPLPGLVCTTLTMAAFGMLCMGVCLFLTVRMLCVMSTTVVECVAGEPVAGWAVRQRDGGAATGPRPGARPPPARPAPPHPRRQWHARAPH